MKERNTSTFQLVGQLGKLRAGCLPALAGRIANPPGPDGAPASLPHKEPLGFSLFSSASSQFTPQ